MATTPPKPVYAAERRSPEHEALGGAPYAFNVNDSTWASVYLFGPVGRSFGAFIDRNRYRHNSKNPRLTLIDLSGTSRSVDVHESLKRAGQDLARLHQQAPHPHHSRDAALQYLDFLLWLEAFLYFLLSHGFPSFMHSNIVSDLLEYHKATFCPPPGLPSSSSDELRAADLLERRRAHQPAHPGSHVPPGITVAVLAPDWADPRAGRRPDSEESWGTFDAKLGLLFSTPSATQIAQLGIEVEKSVAESVISISDPSRHHKDPVSEPPDSLATTATDRKRKASLPSPPPSKRRRDSSQVICAHLGPTACLPLSSPIHPRSTLPTLAPLPDVDTVTPRNLSSADAAPVNITGQTTAGEMIIPPNVSLSVNPIDALPSSTSGGMSLSHILDTHTLTYTSSTRDGPMPGLPLHLPTSAGDVAGRSVIDENDNVQQERGTLIAVVNPAHSLPTHKSEMQPEHAASEANANHQQVGSSTAPPLLPSSGSLPTNKSHNAKSSNSPVRPYNEPDTHWRVYMQPALPLIPSGSRMTTLRSSKGIERPKSKLSNILYPAPASTCSRSSHAATLTADLPRVSDIDAAPGAPRILGAHLVMSFTFGPAPQRFGEETMQGDVQALCAWFRAGNPEGVEDFVWYVEEVLRRAEAELPPDVDPEAGAGETALGLVLQRVSDEPRALGNGTVRADGDAVCHFLGEYNGARRWAGYSRAVLAKVMEIL